MKTDTKTALVKVGTKWSATKKQPKCDIEGINCEEVPPFARLGAAQPSRCVQHTVPDMVTEEAVPLLTSVSSSAAQKQMGSHMHEKKSLVKQVQFNEPSDEGKEYDILQTSKTAVDTSAVGMSCGDLFGQPQTSPVKPDICREKSCKKKATFTLESEADDSIGILCPLIMPREFLVHVHIKLRVSSNVFVVFPISLPVFFVFLLLLIYRVAPF